ncbi:MAG: EamA/RhaT family transporter, partial [Pseudomonadota bacterium]|nr:EamA/RhaT family transporter [Pseudomonadota bacterium]
MDTTGIFLRIGATFFFTLMVILIKFLAEAVPVGQVVFFRSAVALVPLVLFLMWTKDFPSGLRSKRPMGHVMRCLMGCAAMFASFASLKYL